LKLCYILSVPLLLCCSVIWTLKGRDVRRLETAEDSVLNHKIDWDI